MVGTTQPLGQQGQPSGTSDQNSQSNWQMEQVRSSQVESIGYDADKQELYVAWLSGRTSIYSGVPKLVHQDVKNAPSVGKALNLLVKPRYQHRYADAMTQIPTSKLSPIGG
jgi:KTSC domain